LIFNFTPAETHLDTLLEIAARLPLSPWNGGEGRGEEVLLKAIVFPCETPHPPFAKVRLHSPAVHSAAEFSNEFYHSASHSPDSVSSVFFVFSTFFAAFFWLGSELTIDVFSVLGRANFPGPGGQKRKLRFARPRLDFIPLPFIPLPNIPMNFIPLPVIPLTSFLLFSLCSLRSFAAFFLVQVRTDY
jgi:hypothetical protein